VPSFTVKLKAGEDVVLEDSAECDEMVVSASELTKDDAPVELYEGLARRTSSRASVDDIFRCED
jgi:hypothetical protein